MELFSQRDSREESGSELKSRLGHSIKHGKLTEELLSEVKSLFATEELASPQTKTKKSIFETSIRDENPLNQPSKELIIEDHTHDRGP